MQFYACSSYHLRGRSVCTNNLQVPTEIVHRAVIRAFEDQVLRPDLAERAVALALEQLTPALHSVEQEMANVEGAITRLDGEIARLTGAVASGGDMPSLVAGLKDRERQRADLRHRLTGVHRVASAGQGTEDGLQARLRAKLNEWADVLHRQIPQARQALKLMLRGSLLFAPKDDGQQRYYEITGEGTIEKIFASVAHPFMVASPPRFTLALTDRFRLAA